MDIVQINVKIVGPFRQGQRMSNIQSKNVRKTWEWIMYLNMVGNVAPVSSRTNRYQVDSCDEIETLTHLLRFCHQGQMLRQTLKSGTNTN